MPENLRFIVLLIFKYAFHKKMSEQQLAALQEWQKRSSYHQALPDQFRDEKWLQENLKRIHQVPSERMWQNIRARLGEDWVSPPPIPLWKIPSVRKFAAVAAVLLLFVAGWWYVHHPHPRNEPLQPTIAHTSLPAGYKALLILEDGSSIVLDSLPDNKKIAARHNTIITKSDSSRLIYQSIGEKSEDTGYNIVSTRQTSPYTVVLPDGSKVHLNYTSSLRFPIAFYGGTREVFLDGEASFEVVQNKAGPFIINNKGTQIEVLGTYFNIMGYGDEPSSEITLLKGSVKITPSTGTVTVLKPWEQAVVTKDRLETRVLTDSSASAAMAWTERNKPLFSFEYTDLATVVRRIARWYQVTPYLPPHVKGRPYSGDVSRNQPLKEVLRNIEEAESRSAYLIARGDSIIVSATPFK